MSQRVLVGSSPGKDKSMDRATAHDLQAEAALLRKYSAENRAYSNEVRKQVELILRKTHTSASSKLGGPPNRGENDRPTPDDFVTHPCPTECKRRPQHSIAVLIVNEK